MNFILTTSCTFYMSHVVCRVATCLYPVQLQLHTRDAASGTVVNAQLKGNMKSTLNANTFVF